MKEIKWTLPLAEKGRLLGALQRNCACNYEGSRRVSCCPSHTMITSQDSINHLQFGRHLEQRLNKEERK